MTFTVSNRALPFGMARISSGRNRWQSAISRIGCMRCQPTGQSPLILCWGESLLPTSLQQKSGFDITTVSAQTSAAGLMTDPHRLVDSKRRRCASGQIPCRRFPRTREIRHDWRSAGALDYPTVGRAAERHPDRRQQHLSRGALRHRAAAECQPDHSSCQSTAPHGVVDE